MPEQNFTFAHFSDVHLDSWREPELKALNFQAFEMAVSHCLERKVDFVLISGDLYHTANPDMHVLAQSVSVLKKLVNANIPIYIIPGSHDFSHAQKTMLNVLENAGIFTNVVRGEETPEGKLKLHFTTDEKTGVKIAGMLGKKGGMEKHYYQKLDNNHIENEDGFKIFMFHSGLEEYKPEHLKTMEALPLSLLPKKFDYYAGGHIHHPLHVDEADYGKIVIPGAVYPVNYDELEKHKAGKVWINKVSDRKITAECIDLEPKKVVCLEVKIDNSSAAQAEEKILALIKDQKELEDKVVLLKVKGTISTGKVADISWSAIEDAAKAKNAYILKRNIHGLTTKEMETYSVDSSLNVHEIETKIVQENLADRNLPFDTISLAQEMLASLDVEKEDSETAQTFEMKINALFARMLELEKKEAGMLPIPVKAT